mmetsp:Transcript_44821/g.143564  ORF Transcript_44821/g.143564 Transcript_44821/m.143564 type:complete len:242 (-) Transcript_44821:727-1452(-)
MDTIRLGLVFLVHRLCTHSEVSIGPGNVSQGVDVQRDMVHRLRHTVLALEIHPNGPRRDLVDHTLHLVIVEGGTEKQRLHSVAAPTLDLRIQPRDLFAVVLLLKIVGLIEHQKLQLRNIQLASSNVVHDFLQCAHHDIHTLLQGPELLLLVDAADKESDAHRGVVQILVELGHALVGLLCQVPRRLQDDAQRRALALAASHALRRVRGVDLTDGHVALDWILHGPVESRCGHEALATNVRF